MGGRREIWKHYQTKELWGKQPRRGPEKLPTLARAPETLELKVHFTVQVHWTGTGKGCDIVCTLAQGKPPEVTCSRSYEYVWTTTCTTRLSKCFLCQISVHKSWLIYLATILIPYKLGRIYCMMASQHQHTDWLHGLLPWKLGPTGDNFFSFQNWLPIYTRYAYLCLNCKS